MTRSIGRFLQILGLVLLPVGMAGQVARSEVIKPTQMLMITIVGVILFFIGWSMQRSGGKPS
jgi:hypothetical protein